MQKALGWDVLIDHLFDAALLFGANGQVLRWNDAAVALMGLAPATGDQGDVPPHGVEVFDRAGAPLAGSANPITAALADGVPHRLEGFVRHVDGHLVPVTIRAATVPPANGCQGATFVLLHDDSATTVLRRQVEDLRDQALIDNSTGATSRLYAELQLVSRLAEHERYGWGFGAILVAIDDWDGLARRYGDGHRHELVKLAANSLLNAARSSDLVGRWDEGEFLVLLTNVGVDTIQASAERYRRVIEQGQMQAYSEEAHVTVSVGATSAHKNDSVGTMIGRVTRLVEASRAAGGNRASVDK